ncbi:hypothetical protein EON66_03685 [archaeon]|nr:MAG: hypothetical protein EON66_03685 [archaeon]
MLTCVASPAEVHTFLLSEEDAYDKGKGGSSKFAKHRSVSVLRSFQAACDGRPAVGSSLYGMAATVRAPLTRSLLAQRLQASGVRPEILSACVGNILTDNEAVVYPLTFMIMSRYPHFAAMEQLLQGMVAQWRVSLEADIRASRTFHNELVQQQAEGGGTTWSSPRVPDKSEATAEAERALPNPSREGALHVGTSGKDHTTLEETMQVLQYASVCLAKLRFVHNDLVATRLQFASRQALLTGVQRERYFFRVDELTSAWRHGSLLLNDVRTRALSLCTTLIESSLPLAAFHPALACLLQQSLAVDMPSFGGSKILECVCNAPPVGGALVDTSRTARGEGDHVAPKEIAPRGSVPAQPTMEAVTDALAGAPASGITTPSSLRIFIQRPRAALGNERATSLIEQLMEEHGAVNVSELLPLLTIVRCFVDTLAPYDVAAPEYTALLQACEVDAVEAPLLGCDMRHYETATCAARYALPHVLTLLPPATMVQVLASLLTEQSVVFVCGHSMPLAAATHCVLACMAMLHPLVWEQNIRPTVHNGLMSDIASLGLDALAQANVIGVQDIGELPQAAEHMPLDVCVVLLSEGGRMLIHPDTASKLQLPGAAQLTRELTSVLTAEGVTIPQQPALVASRAPAPEPVPAPPEPSATATMPRTTTVAATSTLGGEVLAVHGARDGAVAQGGQRQQESSAAVARERAHTPASTSRSRGRARVHKPTTSGFELALSPTRGGVGALGAAASAAACRAAEQCVPLLYRHVCVLLGHALAAALSMEACEHAGASRTHIQQAVPVQFLPSARGTRVVHSLLPDFWVRFTSSMAWTQHTTVCTHRAMMAAMSNTAPSYSHIGFHYTFETVRSVVHHRVACPGQAIPAPIFPTSPAKLAVVAPGVELGRS